jgi:hypothetical protein
VTVAVLTKVRNILIDMKLLVVEGEAKFVGGMPINANLTRFFFEKYTRSTFPT